MAKKSDKALKDLAKELKKLRKENEKLAESLGTMREDQAEYNRKVLALIQERLAARDADAGEAEDHDENGGFVTAETAADGGDGDVPKASADAQQDHQDHQEGPEVTEAAKRRAKELGVDPSDVKGTGSGRRVLVKDVEAAAGQ
ncbi:MAG TPA: E3 binding domain-containing protein [Rubrobacter sp.]|nr:E3 binding domain-containing protein [Rubrobacter sp.]